jgi:hypothetical protein
MTYLYTAKLAVFGFVACMNDTTVLIARLAYCVLRPSVFEHLSICISMYNSQTSSV